MTKIKGYVILMLIVITILYGVSIFTIKDQYDEKLYKLTKENEELRKTNVQMSKTMDTLYEEVQGKRSVECDCGWYMDFYYDHMEEFGAYE